MDGYLTTQDIALRLGVKVETVRHWIRQGKLQGLSLGRAGYRITETAYKAFVQGKASSQRQPESVVLPGGPSFLPLLEAITDSFVVLDRDGHYLYLNEIACRTLERPRSELIGKVMWQVFPALIDGPLFLAFHQAVQTGQPVLCEYRSILTGRWLNAHLYPANAWVSIYFTDITNHKHAEDSLAFMGAIVDSSQDAIIGKTLDGIIISWNTGACKLYGYEATEVLGRPVTIIIPEERRTEYAQFMDQLRHGERIESLDTIRLRKDGTTIPVSLTLSPVRNAQGELIGASTIARNITERVRLESLRDEFLAMASHELRTPLTSLKGFSALLSRRLAKNSDEQSLAYLTRMEGQISRLSRLVEDLLDLSRIQLNQFSLLKEPLNLAALVSETVEMVQATTSKHLQLIQADQEAIMMVDGDHDRLTQVIYTVLDNAIKYSPRADRVEIRCFSKDDKAIVQVQDFGIGIAPEYHQQIFERFFQAPDQVAKTFPGMGIGLYLACDIIIRHLGSITVDSHPGEGSTFTVQLPLISPERLMALPQEERSEYQHE